ncbi:taurine dioxygenase [Vitreoscilla massiliensis]|uniref:Taurine dioxygenase n=1 Tax=Vitreoscilla massiliensis TaxID=1689272 RepID=A0ABY4E2S8_9NEIS|nr:taurine dioxygenase [Vitreoscilla massiliensis]UOO90068.1 taurine dioxygenase [Vitreoscilla massiliensis]
MKIERLTPAIGAVISGINLNETLNAEAQQDLQAALVEHQVLFLRQQFLEAEQQRDIAQLFGDLHIHPIYPAHERVAEVMVLDSHKQDLRDNELWHTDVTFIQTPPLGCVLSAQQVPEFGGDTLWASSIAAYEALSEPFKELLAGLSASHDIRKSFPATRFAQTEADAARFEKAKRDHPPVSHPVVRTHPVSGKKGLFVSEGFTTHINELSEAESDALLRFLFAHATQPKFHVRWHWQAGDVAIWDNRSTQHFANFDYGTAHRIMHRATVLGDKPV